MMGLKLGLSGCLFVFFSNWVDVFGVVSVCSCKCEEEFCDVWVYFGLISIMLYCVLFREVCVMLYSVFSIGVSGVLLVIIFSRCFLFLSSNLVCLWLLMFVFCLYYFIICLVLLC